MPKSAKAIAQLAEGVVIGSALVERIAQAAHENKTGSDVIAGAAQLIGEIRRAVDTIALNQANNTIS